MLNNQTLNILLAALIELRRRIKILSMIIGIKRVRAANLRYVNISYNLQYLGEPTETVCYSSLSFIPVIPRGVDN